jgi:maltose alpha-D-glucosyltransferase / alpha-amylase
VVANLSRFVQTVRLDLGLFKGRVPVEISGRTEFPEISEAPYFLSMGPYAFYWFTLKLQPSVIQPKPQAEIPTLAVSGAWSSVFSQPELKGKLEALLPDYLAQFRWFGGSTRTVQTAKIVEALAVPYDHRQAYLVGLHVDYIQGDPQTYWLYLSATQGESAIQLLTETPQAAIARLRLAGHDQGAVLYDAIADKTFLTALLTATAQGQTLAGLAGELIVTSTEFFTALSGDRLPVDPSLVGGDHSLVGGDHSNTSIIYSDATNSGSSPQLLLKLFRKAESGINPDLEVRRFLDQQRFEHITSIAGYLEYQPPKATSISVGILQQYIADARSSWDYTLDSLRDYFEQVAMAQTALAEVPVPSSCLLELQTVFDEDLGEDLPLHKGTEPGLPAATLLPYLTEPTETAAARLFAAHTIGAYLANVQLLGQRTAELHVALASNPDNADFAPEPFTSFYQRSMYQYSRNLVGHVFILLKERLNSMPAEVKPLAQMVLHHHQDYLERFRLILDLKITAMRTRYHGSYHLGHVLYTGNNFVIIDFEGNATRNVNERRMKRSPLRDVASMLQSLNYAANFALQSEVENGLIQADQFLRMEQWAQFWENWVSAAFLHAYLKTARQDSFLPTTPQELKVLLNNYLLEQAIYDLGYKLVNRPNQLQIPLQRMLQFQSL